MMSSKRKIAIASFLIMDLALAVALVSLFLVDRDSKIVEELRDIGATIYPESRPLPPFHLLDHRDQPFEADALQGKWTLMFFGFTSCPDICPITMSELAKFYQALETSEFLTDSQVVMVSVDPARDTTAKLGDYVTSFHTDFIGVTGEINSIALLAKQLYVTHTNPADEGSGDQHGDHQAHVATDSAENSDDYLINHSGHISIINPDGKLHSVIRAPHRSRDLQSAYKIIRNL